MNSPDRGGTEAVRTRKTRAERVREIRQARGLPEGGAPQAGSSGPRPPESRGPRNKKSGPRHQNRSASGSRSSRPVKTAPGRRPSPRRRSSPSGRRPAAPLQVLAAALVLILAAVLAVAAVRRFRSGSAGGADTEAPVITLSYDAGYTVIPGLSYEEEGFTAVDDRDGDLTDQVRRTEEDGRIRYEVSDAAGNIAVCYRDIPYAPGSDPSMADAFASEAAKSVESEGKVVYLTFDDGPGEYTERLLEILDRYGVRATFFVTGAHPMYEDMIAKEAAAGHTVGVHTFTHDFARVYASTDAFWKDISEIEEVVIRQTGQATCLMRFAGGSSNTICDDYTPGIMDVLIRQAAEKGFQYFDWNVSSGDGAAEGDSGMVISRITSQLPDQDVCVVLCHDTKEYTVNAMEYLIPWLLDNGYSLQPLTIGSEPAHHVEAE